MRAKRFTLIELLIVVAIILILVALLLPMLSKAKKRARNAICVSNLRQSAMAIFTYSNDNNTHYPYRSVDESWWPGHNIISFTDASGTHDDRDLFRPYFENWQILNCSFTSPNHEKLDKTTAKNVQLSYELYFGSHIDRNESNSGMMKQGDVITFEGNEFSILIADMDRVRKGSSGFWRSAHPDYNPANLTFRAANNENEFFTRWAKGVQARGYVDRNFLMDDGSVKNLGSLEAYDDRLEELWYVSRFAGNDSVFLPAN